MTERYDQYRGNPKRDPQNREDATRDRRNSRFEPGDLEGDPLAWAKIESYQNNFSASNGEDRNLPQERMATPSSWDRDEWNQTVTRSVHSNNPEYDVYGGQSYDSPFENHRGRGPKNFRLSDERIRERLCEQLTDDPHIDASNIELHVNEGVVRLEGSVWTRPMKHRVEDLAADCKGVRDVDNHLRVTGIPQ